MNAKRTINRAVTRTHIPIKYKIVYSFVESLENKIKKFLYKSFFSSRNEAVCAPPGFGSDNKQ